MKLKATGKCYHCGADNGLHQYESNHCPKNGMEEYRDGKKQEWEETVFEDSGIKEFEIMAIDMHEKLVDALETIKEYHYDSLLPVIKIAIDSILKEAKHKA